MERLTQREKHCADPEQIYGVSVKGLDYISAANRLADYEDTELTPEEIRAMQHTLDEYHKVADPLLRAQVEGRLMVLPCKVGDVVYGFHNNRRTILPMVAKWIETNDDGWTVAAQYAPMAPKFYQFSDFGKTVFLTRGEAEKALEAMKNG